MYVFKIGESAEAFWRGDGYAVAAVRDGEVVEMVYVADCIPGFDHRIAGDRERAMSYPEMVEQANRLAMKGEVFTGMCSAREFVVL